MALRFLVPAHLVEHGALRRQDVPVRLIGRVGAVEHFERLLVFAGFGERAAVFAEHDLVVRVLHRHLLEDRDRLGALAGGAQRLGIVQRHIDVAGSARYLAP